jgi:hypothetical protein
MSTPFGFEVTPRIAALNLNPGVAASAFRTRLPEQTIPIDVGASVTKADNSRGGFTIPEIPLLPDRIGSFLDDRPVVSTKVVAQTIQPGTAVAVGTTVDIVLTSTRDLPVAVIPGIHQAFAGLTMAQLHDQFAADTRVRDVLRTRGSVADLTTDDVSLLTTVLAQQNVPVSNAPGETVSSAFTALQAAFTFQS